ISRTPGNLDRKFYKRLWKRFIEVCSRCDEDIWDLRFDRREAANTIVERREISFDINIHVACERIDHRISLEDRHVLHLKKIFLHCGLKDPQIDGLARTQFGWIEFGQYIVEPSQTVKFRVEREPAIIGYLAVVFVKAESSSRKRVGSEVGVDVIHGACF